MLAPLGEGSAGGGRGFGTGLVGGVDVHRDDGVGAGARRCRRSSSLGGNEDDDEVDSPRPPSKRYRNSSTKTRIAFFPSLQVRFLRRADGGFSFLCCFEPLSYCTVL